MRIRSLASATLLAVVAALPAGAQQITSPNSTYLSETTQIAINPALNDFDTFNSVNFFGFSIEFQDATSSSISLERRTVPDSWSSWGLNPETEWDGTSPYRIGFTNGTSYVKFAFSAPIAVFGFEAEGDPFDLRSYTVNYYNGASLVGTISRDIDGNAGARLLAFQYAGGITSAEVMTDTDFSMAQFRVGQSAITATPEPATIALMATGLGLVGVVARRRRNTV